MFKSKLSFICLILFFVSAISFSAETGRIWVESVSGQFGETIDVGVYVEPYTVNIDAFTFDLEYDDSIISYIDCEQGDFAYPNFVMFGCNKLNNESIIRCAGFAETGNEITEETELVILHFEVVGEKGCALILTNTRDDISDYLTRNGTFSYLCLHTGDVNNDGSISAGDAQLAFLMALGSYVPVTPTEACQADCNNDGIITSADAQNVFKAGLGLIECPIIIVNDKDNK